MWDEALARHETEQVADARRLTCEESFREGVALSVLARKLWLASPFRESAEARIDEADLRVHIEELGLTALPHA